MIHDLIRRADVVWAWLAYVLGGLGGLLMTLGVLGLEGTSWRGVVAVVFAGALALLAWWLGAHVRLSRVGLPPRRPVDQVDRPSLDHLPKEKLGPLTKEAPPDEDPLLTMVPLAGGVFRMGSDLQTDPQASSDEQPCHEVRLSPFLMARTPVTRGLWRRVMSDPGAGEWLRPVPSDWTSGDEDLPATHVGWEDAVAFCNALSMVSGRRPFYRVDEDVWSPDPEPAASGAYRLPTEAEWEYACRAGTDTPWSWGNEPGGADEHAWYAGNTGGRLHPVGDKAPNDFGLYDMSGNCSEWCWDWSDSYGPAAVADPRGPGSGRRRVLRGGAFRAGPRDLRSAVRSWGVPWFRDDFIGFRCVRSGAPGSST